MTNAFRTPTPRGPKQRYLSLTLFMAAPKDRGGAAN